MTFEGEKRQNSILAVFLLALVLISSLLLKIGQAEDRPINQEDCANVQHVAALLPPHITAYFGMAGLPQVENIQTDLDRTLAQLMAQDKTLFDWKSIDFEEIIIECQLAWRDENIKLFQKIQKRAAFLSAALDVIQGNFPNMSSLEAGQWLGEGIEADQIPLLKKRGVTPFAARMEKMRRKK